MRSLLPGLLLLALAWPATGYAQDAQVDDSLHARAQALLSQGVELRKTGDDRRALAAFEQAFALESSAQALAQRALAEQALGLWLDAHEHLSAALAEPATDAWIVEHRAALDSALREISAQLGSLEVSCNVVGAEIRLDGRLLGKTPLPGPLKTVAGRGVVQVSSAGYFEVTRQVQIDAGGLSRVEVTLVKEPAESASAANAATSGGDGRATAAAAAHEQSSARDVFMYTSLGLGALGVAVGVTGVVMRQINIKAYNDDARCSRIQGVPRSDECPDEAAAYRRGEALAIGGFAAAGVFGGMTLYLWLTRPKAKETPSFACAALPMSISCAGKF